MYCFEELLHLPGTNTYNYQPISSMIVGSLNINPSNWADTTGNCVCAYSQFILMCDIVSNCCFWFLTNYSFTKKKFKYWNNVLAHYQMHLRNHLSKIFSATKNDFIHLASYFQYQQVCLWNSNIRDVSKVVIPPVLLQDKMKTSGFGIEMIELICLCSILIEEMNQQKRKFWYLAPNYMSHKMICFVDGLSIDRYRHLLKKHTTLPISFCPAFKQSLVFKKHCSV